ncbi:MAG: RNA-guided pseudouridylation complex pseudouridine synthase subunit Cbf5 [Thermoplasmataceae archaeon]
MSQNLQNIDGFVIIDKPKGPTSHQVDHWVRQITGIDKVGHIGTLDPNASGVLVMALGKATKLIDIIHEMPKEYIAVLRLYCDVPSDKLDWAFSEFRGDIFQIPPMRSAVARTLRIRKIYDLSIIERQDRLVLFHVKCESGTYIRTLCTDLGYALGCGGQMADLRRTKTGPFGENDIVTLQELSDAFALAKTGDSSLLIKIIKGMDYPFRDLPKIVVKKSALDNIAHGSDLFPGGISAVIGNPTKGSRVAVYDQDNNLIGTGKMVVSYNEIRDLKVVDFDRVLIEPKTSRKPSRGAQAPVAKNLKHGMDRREDRAKHRNRGNR